eukprot:jgi/Mesvir1/5205/Mv24079-RA.1
MSFTEGAGRGGPAGYRPPAESMRGGPGAGGGGGYGGGGGGPKIQQEPARYLWIGNLTPESNRAVLEDLFGRIGPLESVFVYPNRGFGFVNFLAQKDAERAMAEMRGYNLNGMPLRIEYGKGPGSNINKQSEGPPPGLGKPLNKPTNSLWVGNCGPAVTKEILLGEFSKFGPIDNFKLMADRRCAFVDFANVDDAMRALTSLQGFKVGEDDLRIDFGKGSKARAHHGDGAGDEGDDAPDGSSACLWVGFPPGLHIDDPTLYHHFARFAPVDRVKTFPNRTYAFVQFHDIASAQAAKDNPGSGMLEDGSRISIRYAKSDGGSMMAGAWAGPGGRGEGGPGCTGGGYPWVGTATGRPRGGQAWGIMAQGGGR